jgi:hypothetical protein
MTTVEREARIQGRPFPWQELMELSKWRRDERLRNLDRGDTQVTDIEREYEDALDRILVALGLA